MEALIFMKFETYVHKYLTTNQIFIKIRAKMRAYEAKMRALAMPYKNSDTSQQKSRKYVFGLFWIKKSFYSLFQPRPKYYESFKMEYSDSTSFINRLTPLIFFRVFTFFRGAKMWVPPKNFKKWVIQSVR